MKASIKLRDGKEPLVRAKLPLSILGLPISSGLTLGGSEELGLHLSTHCVAGPCLRLTFWPNHPSAPLSLAVKAGLGPWGSSSGTCLAMSAEIRLPTITTSCSSPPSLMLFIKPRLGDFGLFKEHVAISQSPPPVANKMKKWEFLKSRLEEPAAMVSVAERAKAFSSSEEEVCNVKDRDHQNNHKLAASECLKGWNLLARSILPLGSRMSASFRWRVGIPHDFLGKLASDPHKLVWSKMPVLSLDKVSLVENMFIKEEKQQQQQILGQEEDPLRVEESKELNKVASMCSSMRRQMQLLHAENQVLKHTMEDVRNNLRGDLHKMTTDNWKLPALEEQDMLPDLEELRKAILAAS